jgi:ubiquinone/menaquinone biosynthesis C-methylase UbiE
MELAEYALMDATEGRMWWYRALHARLLHALAGTGPRVLDVGCGTGGFLATLRRHDPERDIIGVEWDESAAQRARIKSGALIARGSANALPIADISCDAAVAADVLCHVAVDPAQALAELHRVLRPSGRLVVNMPAYAWLMSAHDARVHNARRQSARQTAAMLHAADFRNIQTAYWNGLLLPMMVVQRKLLATGDAPSDVAPFPPWLDRMLHATTEIERCLPFRLPAGGSVLAIAERP